jgi:hypothetical protein
MYLAKARLEKRNSTKEGEFWSCGGGMNEKGKGTKFCSRSYFTISLASKAENWLSRDILVQTGRSLKS